MFTHGMFRTDASSVKTPESVITPLEFVNNINISSYPTGLVTIRFSGILILCFLITFCVRKLAGKYKERFVFRSEFVNNINISSYPTGLVTIRFSGILILCFLITFCVRKLAGKYTERFAFEIKFIIFLNDLRISTFSLLWVVIK